ncbi:hypothetical protein BBJ29_009465 [Phytophthora kernoviae]|uniref:Metallo-beta-lactamase domain-containing protein n=1 Tax=Phytophthora kernoviae TaxID=325452 RepID=A0A3F2RDK1_9STRA|nr:hypothetical protein BBJ29_009465 [Phytophthora kernoviae]RLN52698.1 hypothetical protein BBP00_00009537 [Phytophthora kernoviae]
MRVCFYRDCRTINRIQFSKVDVTGVTIEEPVKVDTKWDFELSVGGKFAHDNMMSSTSAFSTTPSNQSCVPLPPWRIMVDDDLRRSLISAAAEQCDVLDKADMRPNLKNLLQKILDLVLDKMGFDLTNGIFSHRAGWESERICIQLEFDEANDELDLLLKYKECKELVETITVANPIAYSLDLLNMLLGSFLRPFSKFLPLPKRAALLIIGDHLNSPIMRAHFLHDATILERATGKSFPPGDVQMNACCIMQQTEHGRRLLETTTEEDMQIVYNHVIPGSEPFELLLVDNPTKSQFKEILMLFFSTGYLQRMVMFSGHGDLNGELICRQSLITNETDENTVTSTPPTFTMPYFDDKTGIRFFPCSDVDSGEIPAGGILELIRSKQLNQIRHGIVDILLGWASTGIYELPLFKHKEWPEWYALNRKHYPKQKLTFIWEAPEQEAAPGLYVFPAHCGDTYVLMLSEYHAVLIDSGFDQHIFADCCWNKFMVPYVKTFDVILTHVDADHIKGFLYLVSEKEFNQQGPKCKRLFMNTPGNQPHRASYKDGQAIAEMLQECGVPILPALRGSEKTELGEVELMGEKYTVNLTIVSPGERDLALEKNIFEWEKQMKRGDTSVSNLSSIVSLISLDPGDTKEPYWRGLFAADSTQKLMKQDLEELSYELPFNANIVTIPHHGSFNNSEGDFSQQFVASQAYIVSTTGYAHKKKSSGVCLPNSEALKKCGTSTTKLYCPYKIEREGVIFQEDSVLDFKDFPRVTDANYESIMQKLKHKPKPWIFFSFDGR